MERAFQEWKKKTQQKKDKSQKGGKKKQIREQGEDQGQWKIVQPCNIRPLKVVEIDVFIYTIYKYINISLHYVGNSKQGKCLCMLMWCVYMYVCVQTQHYIFQDKYVCMYGQSSTQITIEYMQFNTYNLYALIIMGTWYLQQWRRARIQK